MYLAGPSPFLSVILAVALFLPGTWAAALAADDFPLDLPGVLSLAFAVTIAIGGLVAGVSWLLGGGLMVVAIVLAVSSLASVALLVRRRGRLHVAAGGWPGVAIGCTAALISLFQGQELGGSADQFYHLAAIRSLLLSGQPLVTDPFFGTTARLLDPTSGAWHSVAASLSLLTHVDPLDLAPALTAATTALFAMCLWSLFRRVSGSRAVPAVMTVAFIGVVELFDFRASAYPNRFSWALAIFGLVLLARLANSRSRALLIAAVAVGFATVVTHLGSAELYAAGGVALLAWTAVAAIVRRVRTGDWVLAGVARVGAAVAAVMLVALPLLLPRVGELRGTDVLRSRGATGLPLEHFVFLGNKLAIANPFQVPDGWLIVLSVPLLVFAAIGAFRARDQRAFLALGLGSMRVLVIYDPLLLGWMLTISPYMTSRLASLLVFAPFCVLAWGMGTGLRERNRWMLAACAAALVIVTVLTLSDLRRVWLGDMTDPATMAFTHSADVRITWGDGEIDRLRKALGPGRPLVAAYPNTAMQVAAIANVRVLAVPQPNTPASFEDRAMGAVRLDMMEAFDSQNPADFRLSVFRKYGAQFVVIDSLHIPSLSVTAIEMLNDPAYHLLEQSNGLFVFSVSKA